MAIQSSEMFHLRLSEHNSASPSHTFYCEAQDLHEKNLWSVITPMNPLEMNSAKYIYCCLCFINYCLLFNLIL